MKKPKAARRVRPKPLWGILTFKGEWWGVPYPFAFATKADADRFLRNNNFDTFATSVRLEIREPTLAAIEAHEAQQGGGEGGAG
jgi:hypothetical protein